MMMMTVLLFYIQQLLSLTTKNGQLNATSDDVDRQSSLISQTAVMCGLTTVCSVQVQHRNQFYEDGLCCVSQWYRTF